MTPSTTGARARLPERDRILAERVSGTTEVTVATR
jgi:hypothetical protein